MKKFLTVIAGVVLLMAFVGCGPERVYVSARYHSPYYRPPRPYPTSVWIEGGWYYNDSVRVYRQGNWGPPAKYNHRHEYNYGHGHGHKYSNRGRRH